MVKWLICQAGFSATVFSCTYCIPAGLVDLKPFVRETSLGQSMTMSSASLPSPNPPHGNLWKQRSSCYLNNLPKHSVKQELFWLQEHCFPYESPHRSGTVLLSMHDGSKVKALSSQLRFSIGSQNLLGYTRWLSVWYTVTRTKQL